MNDMDTACSMVLSAKLDVPSAERRSWLNGFGASHVPSPRMTTARRQSGGFTIVELLTVVGVIALLMAITVPALQGVQTRTRKTLEANNIRQVFIAWQTYGNQNRDAAAPGYIDPEVQEAWRIMSEYPVPPDAGNAANRMIPRDIAAAWTWRLAPYFDHNIETIWKYRDAPSLNLPLLVGMARSGSLTDQGINDVDELMLAIAEEPAFGYNAFHVGGWWEMRELPPPGGSGAMPQPLFFDAKLPGIDRTPVDVVSRSIPSIRRPGELIVFCTSTRYRNTGMHRIRDHDHPGSFVVRPPFMAEEAQWESPPPANAAYTERIQTFSNDTEAPLGRYNDRPTLINADGSIDSPTMMMLFDMRRWIDNPLGMDLATDEPYNPWFTQ